MEEYFTYSFLLLMFLILLDFWERKVHSEADPARDQPRGKKRQSLVSIFGAAVQEQLRNIC